MTQPNQYTKSLKQEVEEACEILGKDASVENIEEILTQPFDSKYVKKLRNDYFNRKLGRHRSDLPSHLYYSRAEAAKSLKISDTKLKLLIRKGRVKAIRQIGGRYKLKKSDVRQLRHELEQEQRQQQKLTPIQQNKPKNEPTQPVASPQKKVIGVANVNETKIIKQTLQALAMLETMSLKEAISILTKIEALKTTLKM
jgi:excisionase family DNA binding protein